MHFSCMHARATAASGEGPHAQQLEWSPNFDAASDPRCGGSLRRPLCCLHRCVGPPPWLSGTHVLPADVQESDPPHARDRELVPQTAAAG